MQSSGLMGALENLAAGDGGGWRARPDSRGGWVWTVSRHCPALLAALIALWVVVAALQEWCSWEEVPTALRILY